MSAEQSTPKVDVGELRRRLDGVMLRDRRRLGRRVDGARKAKPEARREQSLLRIAADVATAEVRIAARRESVPIIIYPDLPVSARRDDIAAAIRDNQVVIVAGETGSGKTTQLPKILLELGRGITGQIGHTQPRRIAARAVADRVAEELGVEVGGAVGYQVRFTDHSSQGTECQGGQHEDEDRFKMRNLGHGHCPEGQGSEKEKDIIFSLKVETFHRYKSY